MTLTKVEAVRCPRCADEVWSRHRHDMRYCKCGYCFIDGGRHYSRVGYGGDGFQQPWQKPEMIELEVEIANPPKRPGRVF